MVTHQIKKLPKNTIEITVIIPKADIASQYEKSFEKLQKELTVEGFRKGKAPKAVAEKHLPKDQVYRAMMNDYLPAVYEDIMKKEQFKPIMTPRLELASAKDGEDWTVKISLAEKPDIKLGNYKDVVKKAKADTKSADIWVPGKDKKEPEQQVKNEQTMNAVLSSLLKEISVELSDLVIEEELNSRLSRLVDDVQKAGLTMEAYLKSKNLTQEQLKEQFKTELSDTYKMEFLLNEIADEEKIKVEKEDLDKLFANIENEKDKQAAQQNAYFYASILRKQKTLDYIMGL